MRELAPLFTTVLGASRPLKNVGEAAETRQKQAKKRSLRAVNEHFEPVFNAVSATQVVFQRPAIGASAAPLDAGRVTLGGPQRLASGRAE